MTHSAIRYTYSVPDTKPDAMDSGADMVPVFWSLKSNEETDVKEKNLPK